MQSNRWNLVKVAMAVLAVGTTFFIFHFVNNDKKPISEERTESASEGLKKGGAAWFAAYHQAIRTRFGDPFPRYTPNYKVKAMRQAFRNRKDVIKLRESLPWIERGPGNVGGRVRGLLVDPEDTTHMTWFLGSASGGVWKTEDGGQNWRHLTEDLPNLATSTLAMSPANPDIIYAGTGEGYDDLMVTGHGIWKSLDRGETWTQLPSTANDDLRFGNVMRMVINPDDPNELVICSKNSLRLEFDNQRPFGYILRTTDGGQTWRTSFTAGRTIPHLIADPSDFNTMYASVLGTGIYKSTDAGASWQQVFDARGLQIRRMELAVSPTDPSRVYFSAESFINDFELYKSKDGGLTWGRVKGADAENDFGQIFNGQGWYDNTIAVHPYDPETVFVGGAGPIVRISTTDALTQSVELKAVENNTDFLSFIDLPFLGEGVILVEDFGQFTGVEPQVQTEDYVDVEIRFGPDKRQKVHRFFFPQFSVEGLYRDYMDLPFEVWDVTNNRQLMVSFTDDNDDGEWTLEENTPDTQGGEALIIHAIEYDPDEAEAAIIGDPFRKGLYMVFVGYSSDDPVDLNEVPESQIRIDIEASVDLAGTIAPITDGYGQFLFQFPGSSSKGVHVDHHNLILIPDDEQTQNFYILNANDGGVAFSTDGGESFIQTGDTFNEDGDFTTLKGFNTAQFYGVDKMNGADRYIGGTQDNGSWLSGTDPDADSDWNSAPSGDGFEAAWHYQNPDLILESSQFNNIYRSEDGGQTWENVNPPGEGPFITRIANSKQDPDLIFVCSDLGVVRSQDFGTNWEIIEMPDTWRFDRSVGPPIEISLASSLVTWTGAAMTENSRIVVSRDGGSTFEPTANYEEAELGFVTGLATHPFDPQTAFALFSMADGPKILKTTDFGENWEDISGFVTNRDESTNGFPDVAVYSLVVMPYDTNIVWAGTEIGLFDSVDGGANWQYAENGLPPVAIWEMKIVNDEVVLATHGRGIWSVAIPELEDYVLPETTLPPQISVNEEGFNGFLEGTLSLRSAYDSSFIRVEVPLVEDTFVFQSPVIEGNPEPLNQEYQLSVTNLPDDTVLIADVKIVAYRNGVPLSATAKSMVFNVDEEAVFNYFNDFDQGLKDFARLGLNVLEPSGFENDALHSPHPYDGLSTYFGVLQVPIIVDTFPLRYDEVVLVEPGDTPEFGSQDFYDFVVVEATNDNGKNWIALEGYDSRFRTSWLRAYEREEDGDASLLEEHRIDFLTKFDLGDTIYLRFKLVSDPFVEGWGWAVDNIRIGNDPLTNVEDFTRDDNLDLSIFPNPVRGPLQISYNLPETTPVTIGVHSLTGQHLQQWPQGDQSVGSHRLDLDLSTFMPGTYIISLVTSKRSIAKKILIIN